MKLTKILKDVYEDRQRGAALVTVLFISLLLLTATAAMLSAIGANSRNTTDVLSETKAYYAAETGLQASVNVLRNYVEGDGTGVNYTEAVADPDLSTWLPYSGGQVPIGTGTGTGYSIQVSNPDGSGAVTYSSGGKFTGTAVGQVDGDRLCIPSCFVVDDTSGTGTGIWTQITISGSGGAQTPSSPNTLVGAFTVVHGPNGAAATTLSNTTFRIDYRILTPRVGVASIYGTVTGDTASTMTVGFQSPEYRLMGNTIRLCSAQNTGSPCPVVTLNISDVAPLADRQFFVNSNPSFSPEAYRLVLTSTGYGPNGAKKTLEGIVQRNLFNGFDPPATMSLIGPHDDGVNTFFYHPGNSNGTTYSGGNCATRCIPSFAVADVNPAEAQLNLDDINTANAALGTPPTPGSQLVEMANLPSWLQSPADLDAVIDRVRTTAQHSNRYFTGGPTVTNPGNFTSGTGITFCEGSCNVKGDGGGLLVVTGQVTALGGFNFKGLIIVTGRGGWSRNGGGNGSILGAIILAPYNRSPYVPENIPSWTNFLAPSYDMSGGGGSDVTNTDINPFIDNSLAVSDIMAGVAEK